MAAGTRRHIESQMFTSENETPPNVRKHASVTSQTGSALRGAKIIAISGVMRNKKQLLEVVRGVHLSFSVSLPYSQRIQPTPLSLCEVDSHTEAETS
eukprot:COSAG02_NODE_250_length_27076_cov_24.440618_12_plen_97_part_00